MNNNGGSRLGYPRYLSIPFLFVPDGIPDPPEVAQFKRDYPSWFEIRATFTPDESPELEPEAAQLEEPDTWGRPDRDGHSQSADHHDVYAATPVLISPPRPAPSWPYGISKAEAQAKFAAACWAAHDQTTDVALNKEQPETPRETANSTHQGDVQAGPAAAASAGNATQPAPPDPLIATPEEIRAFHDWLAARSDGEAAHDSDSYQDQPVIGYVTRVSDVEGPSPSDADADSPSAADGTPTAQTAVSGARQAVPIYGKLQNNTGKKGDLHAGRSLNEARALARDPKVASVHMNRSLRTVTGDKTAPNVRPDVAGVEHPGPDGKIGVRMLEVRSPRQNERKLLAKMKSAGIQLPEGYRPTTTEVVKPAPELPVEEPDLLPDLDMPDMPFP